MNFKRKTILLILIATLVRSIAAGCVELGNDEVYYRMYAQFLQWNYFDHPPIVGWLIRVTTFNLSLDNEFFIRSGAILSAAITSWLLFLCGRKLMNEYAGFLAVLIYTATLYGSIIAGVFILPDSPQMIFWSGALYLLIDIAGRRIMDDEKKKKLIWFGFVAGIGMLCKIHTSFLWFGLLLYILFYDIKWLKQPVLYLAGIITLLVFLPVIKWNIDNHFITYLYHSKRINVAGSAIDLQSFFTFIAGQVFYYNPVIFILVIITISAALKNKLPVNLNQKWMLLFCSLPLICIALIISLFKNVLPHWTGPAYTSLILLTACYFAERNSIKKIIPKPMIAAVSLSVAIIISAIWIINFFPGTPGKKDVPFTGEGDFTLDMYGWRKSKKDLWKIIQQDELSGTMKKGAVIISNKWFPAAHIDYYMAMPLKKDLIALGDTSDIHQYAWINNERKALHAGDDAYCVVPSENYFDAAQFYSTLFKTILLPVMIEQKRNGNRCRILYLYRLKGYTGR